MSYADHRTKIKSGDLLAWSHRPWGSWYDLKVQAVRMFTRSEYCHVGIAWCVADRLFALEAVLAEVRIFPLSRMLPFYHIPVPAQWEPEVEAWALKQIGEQYSQWQAIKAGLGLLKAGDDSIWQCAEYAQEVLARAGIVLPGDPTPTNIVAQAMKFGPCWLVNE